MLRSVSRIGAALILAGATLFVAGGGPTQASSQFSPGQAAGNRGDVWISCSSDPGPGHQNDPHLGVCATVRIWGDGLAQSSGLFTIDGWPPTGKGDQAYPSSGSADWSYDTGAGGAQIIATVDAATLIANAEANGDTPHPIQGYHFKVQFLQEVKAPDALPKHKTFWIDPLESTPTPTPTPTPTATPTPTPTGSPGALTATPTPSGVLGVSTPSTGLGGNPLSFLGIALMILGLALIAVGRRGRRVEEQLIV